MPLYLRIHNGSEISSKNPLCNMDPRPQPGFYSGNIDIILNVKRSRHRCCFCQLNIADQKRSICIEHGIQSIPHCFWFFAIILGVKKCNQSLVILVQRLPQFICFHFSQKGIRRIVQRDCLIEQCNCIGEVGHSHSHSRVGGIAFYARNNLCPAMQCEVLKKKFSKLIAEIEQKRSAKKE